MKKSYVTWLNIEYPSEHKGKEIEIWLEELLESKPLPGDATSVEVHTPVRIKGKIVVSLGIPFRAPSLTIARSKVKDLVRFFSRETGRQVRVSVAPTHSDD